MALEPLSDHICIEPIEEEEERVGSIIIPDTAKEKPQFGKVIAVGPGRRKEDGTRQPLSVKPGDKVIYSKYGGTEFELDGAEYLILRESDVLAVVEEG